MSVESDTIQCLTWSHHIRNVWCSNPFCPAKIFTHIHPSTPGYSLIFDWTLKQMQNGWSLRKSIDGVSHTLSSLHQTVDSARYKVLAIKREQLNG